MTAAFDGTTFGEGYLTCAAGEHVYLQPGDDGGWATGQLQRGDQWLSGWIPVNYWQASQ